MAVDLLAVADGNLTAAATWGLADATGTLISTNTGTTTLTVAVLDSATFTPGAITVVGVALRLGSRAAGSPSNTVTVTLRNSTDAVNVISVTANVSDLPVSATGAANEGGWHYFKFSAAQLLIAGKAYLIRVNLSATTTAVALCTNGVANNWQRVLVTSTTQAPVAGDDMYLAQTLDGAANPATVTARSVTMDSTAATDYGRASTNTYTPSLSISKACTLVYDTGALNYILRQSGSLVVFASGTLAMGTVATPCPRTATYVLEFDNAADGQFGLIIRNLGNLTAQGQSRTAAKSFVQCKLNGDEAAAQTTLSVDIDTGWLSGDEIVIAPTGTTSAQFEKRTLNGNAAATTIDITAGLTNAHSGTSPTQAEIILITHFVKIRSVSSTNMSFTQYDATSVVDMDWVEFQYLGVQFTPVGLAINTTTGSFALSFACIKDGDASPITTATNADNFSIQDLTLTGNSTLTNTAGIAISATTGTNWSLKRITSIGGGQSGGSHFNMSDLNGTIQDLVCAGGSFGAGINLQDIVGFNWTVAGFTGHSLGSSIPAILCSVAGVKDGTFTNVNVWRNGGGFTGGIHFTGCVLMGLTLDTGKIFGNSGAGIMCRANNTQVSGLVCKSIDFAGDTTNAQPRGVHIDPNGPASILPDWRFENCTFGVTSGIMVAHSTADFDILSAGNSYVTITLINCKLASATEVTTTALPNTNNGSYIRSLQHDQTVNHKIWARWGTVNYETATVDVAPAAIKMTPSSASVKLDSSANTRGRGFVVPIDSGQSVTISVRVQKNVAYNGNQPRLIRKSAPQLGFLTDAVLATMVGGAGVYETLSAATGAVSALGVLEFVVDCDGTLGDAFVDTWVAT